jgi:outer membrane protein OmpA-like peptidoglycan-associated protein
VRCSMTIIGSARRRAGWIVALGAVLAGGCTTVSPATGGHEISASASASGGAAAGWISGESSKQSLRRAATGAGVGELAGGSVGYYMDVQESKLREQLDGSGVGVVRKGDEVTLSLPGNLAFAADSADLNAAFDGVLDAVAVVLRKYDKTVIEVAGHTDGTGGHEHNQALSERRAAAVAAYLEKRGILKGRIVAVGAGETRPVASNETSDGRARNRRVELTVAPLAATRG